MSNFRVTSWVSIRDVKVTITVPIVVGEEKRRKFVEQNAIIAGTKLYII